MWVLVGATLLASVIAAFACRPASQPEVAGPETGPAVSAPDAPLRSDEPAVTIPVAPIGPRTAAPPALPDVVPQSPRLPPPQPPAAVVVPAPVQRPPSPALDVLRAWVQSVRPTPLRGGPNDDAAKFTDLPSGGYLKIVEARADWVLAAYAGDGDTRAPGLAWVRASDIAPVPTTPRWTRNYVSTELWSGTDASATRYTTLPDWSWLELLGPAEQGRLLIRYPGDGRTRAPGEAWVEAKDLVPSRTPGEDAVPRAFPLTTRRDIVRIPVPYRSQLDGTPWATANCGPATLGMALESLGVTISSTELRRQVLDAQQIWSDDVGSLMEALVTVARDNNATVLDFARNGARVRWSVDDVRRHVQAGRPVIAQVAFQALPGRAEALYEGDHYIVITGLIGDDFLYNDSIDSDGVGFDRVISAANLSRAMNTSDRRYTYAAFALGD